MRLQTFFLKVSSNLNKMVHNANICMISLCKPLVTTIKFQPSVLIPFSCKTSIATTLFRQPQAISWKPSNVTPQSQTFSPKFSFETLQSQPVCCNLLLVYTCKNDQFLMSIQVFKSYITTIAKNVMVAM